jgi:hypothetical protein
MVLLLGIGWGGARIAKRPGDVGEGVVGQNERVVQALFLGVEQVGEAAARALCCDPWKKLPIV